MIMRINFRKQIEKSILDKKVNKIFVNSKNKAEIFEYFWTVEKVLVNNILKDNEISLFLSIDN